MSNDTTNLNSGEVQQRFLELLKKLTQAGKIKWAQSQNEPGFVYCWTGEDLIVFELQDGKNEPAPPGGELAGIVGKCRNTTYLWLPPSTGWDALRDLLVRAPVEDAKFIEFRRKAKASPVHALESL